MNRILTTFAALFIVARAALGEGPAGDVRSFELTAVAPPQPVLKYRLLFDTLPEQSPGNAALLYMQAILIMGNGPGDQADKALAAYEAKDFKAFNAAANALEPPGLFQVLELAARRRECDWQAPLREMGVETRLPYLNPLREVSKVIKVRALRQIEQGKADDALGTLRLGYDLAEKVGQDPAMVCSIVSVHLTMSMNEALSRLMNRPECPNLYWALVNFPSRRNTFHTGFIGEKQFLVASLPSLAKALAGQELTAQEWRAVFDYIGKVMADVVNPPKKIDPVKDAKPATFTEAQQQYARQHRLLPEQVLKLDPLVVLGDLYFRQAQVVADDIFKLAGLGYPQLLATGSQRDESANRLRDEYPGNPFLAVAPAVQKYFVTFARADRQQAALTAVEALRSYAAAHDGKLPERLADLTDTPAPDNPLTGRPFDYRVENNVATLSDPQTDSPLTYTIKIRK